LGAEILKNLVLPGISSPLSNIKTFDRNNQIKGIGSFTIVDQGTVTDADLGSNFFLSPSNLGQSKAESMIPSLLEMNEEVQGKFIQKVNVHFMGLKCLHGDSLWTGPGSTDSTRPGFL
jgi:molybdopterin/thiamine biosynthesis adenylyltransferase